MTPRRRWGHARTISDKVYIHVAGDLLWAGEGGPRTRDGRAMEVFEDDDPRGRPEGSQEIARAARAAAQAEKAERRRAKAVAAGQRPSVRRMAAGVSVHELAERAEVQPTLLEDLEAGDIEDVPLKTSIALVWGTIEPWPQARDDALTRWGGKKLIFGAMMRDDVLSQAEDYVSRLMGTR